MAILWIEGFEGVGALSGDPDLAHKYNNITNMTGVFADIVTGRTGGLAVKCGDAANVSRFQTPNFGDKKTVIVGMAWKPGTVWSSSGNRIFSLRVGTTETMGVWYKTDGNLEVRRGTTILATTTGAPATLDTWHIIEFKTMIDNTLGAYELRFNGAQLLTASNLDTQETADAFVNGCRFFGSFGTGPSFFTLDDIYILDDTGANNNNFIGPQKVVGIVPDADGSETDFTPLSGVDNFAMVDENPRDDDTSHVESATTGARDLYGHNGSSLNQINGVQVNAVAKWVTATDNILLKVKSGTTVGGGPTEAASSAYTNHYHILEDDPDTGDDWAPDAMDAAELGVEVG